ncbi:MAG: hypothetical protein R2873_22845 [Caldilineaceae bacterium]
MTTLLAQIAPQRSTQYAELANALASHELALSPLGAVITESAPVTLGGQAYLKCELTAELEASHLHELGLLATTSAYFDFYDQLGDHPGPLLRPIETDFRPQLPLDLVEARRYRGKTNEMFTHFLCNVARFSSGYAHERWDRLRVLDPLAGGGTTLFTALVLGADAAGVEKDAKDVESTATFLKQYVREKGIACRIQEDRLKKVGKRWQFTIGKETTQRCILANGDTAQSGELLVGIKKAHLIVTDLPYGVQHQGQLAGLLSQGLPVWTSLLLDHGALVFSWDATRFPRDEMIAVVEANSPLKVLSDPPYDQLAHRVDRVIKQRDVLVARR